MHDNIILTRYLYNRDTVFHQLGECIRNKEYEKSLFWAYELYFSWYEEELIKYLVDIINKEYSQYKFMKAFLKKHLAEWISEPITNKPHEFIATIIRNLVLRSPMGIENNKFPLIFVLEEDIEKYYTVQDINILPTIDLDKYDCMNIEFEKLYDLCDNWLYYASKNPLWKYRIGQFKGIIDNKKRRVIFPNSSAKEQFSENFGYKFDMKLPEFQIRCFGL
jgi:hypothetical protein